MASGNVEANRSVRRRGRLSALVSIAATLLLLRAAAHSEPPQTPGQPEMPLPEQPRQGPGVVSLLASVALTALALWLRSENQDDQSLAGQLPLLLLAVAAATAIAGLAASRTQLFKRLFAGFGAGAAWVPFVAAIATVSTILVVPDAESPQGRLAATGSGLLLGIAGWTVLALGMGYRNEPARVNSRVWGELNERYRTLRTRLAAVSNPSSPVAYQEAKSHLDWLASVGLGEEDPGARNRQSSRRDVEVVNWAQGYRYVDLLTAIHRAEEAMIELLPVERLKGEVMHDRLRLSGSILEDLTARVTEFSEGGVSGTRPNRSDAGRRAALMPVAVREVRHALNDFRDSRVDGIIRARNRLARTTMMTSFTAYLLLLLSLAIGAPRVSIAAAAIFFLVGALIGLFAQLRSDAENEEAVEDYGFNAARLRQTAVASGLGAIAGVVLTAIAIDTTGTSDAQVTLGTIFDIGDSPGQLLIAAVFGLSPQLVIERLTAKADEYRQDLTDTEATSTESKGDKRKRR